MQAPQEICKRLTYKDMFIKHVANLLVNVAVMTEKLY